MPTSKATYYVYDYTTRRNRRMKLKPITPPKLALGDWALHTDTELAKMHGGARQTWSAYRKRHGLSASPAGRFNAKSSK